MTTTTLGKDFVVHRGCASFHCPVWLPSSSACRCQIVCPRWFGGVSDMHAGATGPVNISSTWLTCCQHLPSWKPVPLLHQSRLPGDTRQGWFWGVITMIYVRGSTLTCPACGNQGAEKCERTTGRTDDCQERGGTYMCEVTWPQWGSAVRINLG